MKYTIFSIILFPFVTLQAQPYIEGGHTRHRFAQLEIGLDNLLGPAQQDLSWTYQPRLVIGGTHFWGHADLYLTFPLGNPGKPEVRTGIETGFRIFPWAIERKKLRPFVGGSFYPRIVEIDNGPENVIMDLALQGGILYSTGRHQISLGLYYFPRERVQYPDLSGQETTLSLPVQYLSLRYAWTLETTLSAEKPLKSGRTAFLEDTLAKLGRLNGWTLGVGASVSFFTQISEQNYLQDPLLGKHRVSKVFPEFSLGYYFHRPDIQLELLYRGVRSEKTGYEGSHSVRRKALTLSGYHFFADYHGFAPFAGGGLSLEDLRVTEDRNGKRIDEGQRNSVRPTFIIGWDIRPNRLQAFYLRTSIRWTPNSLITSSGTNFTTNQLEVNFIHLVVFPGRF